MKRRVIENVRPFVAEMLEERRLFAGTLTALPSPLFSPSASLLDDTVQANGSKLAVTGGFMITADGLPTPTGTVTFQWYGGSVLAVVPINGDGTIQQAQLTLNFSESGPAIPSGPFTGDHVLTYFYS